MEVGRKGRQWAQHGFNNKNSGRCRLRGLFWRQPRSEVGRPGGEEGGGGGEGGRTAAAEEQIFTRLTN